MARTLPAQDQVAVHPRVPAHGAMFWTIAGVWEFEGA